MTASVPRGHPPTLVDRVRSACSRVAADATHVRVAEEVIPEYAASLPSPITPTGHDPDVHVVGGGPEADAAYFLCLNAISFGSGWWPTIRTRADRSAYVTIASGLRDRWFTRGCWPADELAGIEAREIAEVTGQDPDHPLMEPYSASLRDVGTRVRDEYAGHFLGVAERAGRSAVELVETLASWDAFADVSTHRAGVVPFFKRAQVVAGDLHLAGVARYGDLDRLTSFADNTVLHVLRLDGVLRLDRELVRRIDSRQLLESGSPEEVELRACAVHAVELIVAELAGKLCSQQVDVLLWDRGQDPAYKAVPRFLARSTAY